MPFDVALPPARKIGIVGSRRRDSEADLQLTSSAFNKIYRSGDSIISGGCSRGGDRFAEVIARRRGLMITIYHADWNTKGKAAGFIRNQDIADNCDILIAVVAEDRTGGTEDTIVKAEKLGRKIILI